MRFLLVRPDRAEVVVATLMSPYLRA